MEEVDIPVARMESPPKEGQDKLQSSKDLLSLHILLAEDNNSPKVEGRILVEAALRMAAGMFQATVGKLQATVGKLQATVGKLQAVVDKEQVVSNLKQAECVCHVRMEDVHDGAFPSSSSSSFYSIVHNIQIKQQHLSR